MIHVTLLDHCSDQCCQLNPISRPVALVSRTFSKTECNYPTVEKEATSIVEAVREWSHVLYGKPFTRQ